MSGGANFNIPGTPVPPAEEQTQTTDLTGEEAGATTPASPTAQTPLVPTDEAPNPSAPSMPFALSFVIIVVALIGLALFFFFTWLSSRFNFIFLDVITGQNPALLESFRTHREIGNSYFRWSLGFLLAFLGLLLMVGLLIWLTVITSGVLKVLLGTLAFIFSLGFLIGFIITAFLAADFVTAVMYHDKIPILAAFRKFLSYKPSFGRLALYFLIKFAFGILAGILGFILVFAVLLVVGLLAGLIFLLGWGLVSLLPFLKVFLTVVGMILLIPAVLLAIVLAGVLILPIPVFFRVFSVAYLPRLAPEYRLWRE